MEDSGKKKIIILKFFILFCLLVITVSLIGFAWARYVSSRSGDTEAQVAKWSFKVVDGDASTIDVLDFPITRTDNNQAVDKNTIAPGTYGKFEIDIDARGTETILTYEIKIGFTNKPVNLKFYSDEAMTNEITLDNNGKLILTEFLSLTDVNYIQPNIIYWNWPLETGTTKAEIDYNDELDSDFMGKTLTMAITVTGTQALDYTFSQNAASTTINNVTTEYATLQEAITAAGNTSGATVALLKDRVEGRVNINSAQDIVLNLNGKRLTMNNSIYNNGKLTIEGSGTITSSTAHTIINAKTATLIKNGNGTLENTSKDNRAISARGTINLNAGTIINTYNDGISGGVAISVFDETNTQLIISGATVSGTRLAIYNVASSTSTDNPPVRINSGTIIGRIQNDNGLFYINGGNFISDDVCIDNRTGKLFVNNANISAGTYAIINSNNQEVTIQNTNVTKSQYGITNQQNGTKVNVINCTIMSETHGILNRNNGIVELYNSEITGRNAIYNRYKSEEEGGAEAGNGQIIVHSGTLNGRVYIEYGTFIFGDNDNTMNNNNPVIKSDIEALYIAMGVTANVKIYDGIIKSSYGGSAIVDNGTTTYELATGYHIATGTETINNTTYKTAFLERE